MIYATVFSFLVWAMTEPLDMACRKAHKKAHPKAKWHPPTIWTWTSSTALTFVFVIPAMRMSGTI